MRRDQLKITIVYGTQSSARELIEACFVRYLRRVLECRKK